MLRYPPTTDGSLRVSSQADQLLLQWSQQHLAIGTSTTVLHDRFGVLTYGLREPVQSITAYHSQEEALRRNASGTLPATVSLLSDPQPVHQAVLRLPKSLDLLEYYLAYLATHAQPGLLLAIGFMTRHFTPRLLTLAGKYAATVTQTRAQKKARLLLLSDFKPTGEGAGPQVLMNTQTYAGVEYRQYYGVFSAGHVDYATQFLLDNWEEVLPASLTPKTILDVACGNGVIGDQLVRRYPDAQLTATDDFILAVASAKLNLPADRSSVLYDHRLEQIAAGSQELVVTNPPFHFGHENNLDVSLALFHQVRRVLAPEGVFVVVANRHLNYATHLGRSFRRVEGVVENEKYVVYRCTQEDQPKDL